LKSASSWTGRTSIRSLIIGSTLRLQVGILLIGLGLPVLAVIPLHLQQQLIDDAIPGRAIGQITTLALEYGAAVIAAGTLKFLVTYLRGLVQEIVDRVLRMAIVEAQRHRSIADANQSLGAVTSAITGEVEDIGAFAAEALNTPVIEGGTLISVIGFVAYADLRLAVIGLGALFVQALITPWLQNRVNRLTRKRIMALRRVGLNLIDDTEPDLQHQVIRALADIRRTYRLRLRMNVLKALTKVLNNLVLNFATILILSYGGWMVIQGQISLGIVVAFVTGLQQIGDHWGELLDYYRRYTDAQVKFLLVAHAAAPGPAR
jgi:ABC-type bacteriocin/lantibiotic exporter with double-glycine peptidase domain